MKTKVKKKNSANFFINQTLVHDPPPHFWEDPLGRFWKLDPLGRFEKLDPLGKISRKSNPLGKKFDPLGN